MKALVKFHNIKKIEDNRNGTLTLHYYNSLSVVKANNKIHGQDSDKHMRFGEMLSVTIEKGQMVNCYA